MKKIFLVIAIIITIIGAFSCGFFWGRGFSVKHNETPFNIAPFKVEPYEIVPQFPEGKIV